VVNSKHAFWQALVFTIIVFVIGVILGFYLENSRSKSIETIIINSEISLLDEQIKNQGLGKFKISCEESKQSIFNFAESIYQEALQLEEFDSSAKFTEILRTLHKRYDLLRVLLWMEGIDLKEKCEESIHTVIYLFAYGIEDIDTRAVQASNSRLLLDIKNTHENKILLIPIAGNLEIESVELIKTKYGITKLPAIIIDEQTVITEQKTFRELEEIIFGRNSVQSGKIILN
jgi:hypothetical protein